ncbi:MAG: antibiotic biosynthesis monooxygenase [Gammaproteobacteria bacterium]|nr:antibiotic biosynthesis monooxygenase [Gammaproteobacteria bacterium]MCP5198782.1 antibiotic biosynthesis monooxygenase [Gammaproteobacteria bacterium]
MQILEGLEAPYYAVIFSARASADQTDYETTIGRMLELVADMPGFLGVESAHDESGEVVVSYWRDEDAILGWKRHVEHRAAQQRGRAQWYDAYAVRVARVERSYTFFAASG